MKEAIKEFWTLYDMYIETEDKRLMPRLSELLSMIENKDRATQLFRPEKNWNKIYAWQILRDQHFTFSKTLFHLNKGEIISWSPRMGGYVFLTRIPSSSMMNEKFLKPGYFFSHEDHEKLVESHKIMADTGDYVADERGLYLPLYDFLTVTKLASTQLDKAKDSVKDYLVHEQDRYV